MERYKLKTLYTKTQLYNALNTFAGNSGLLMGLESELIQDILSFVASCVYGYFFDDYVAYDGEDDAEVKDVFLNRMGFDICVKLPYWSRKYQQIKDLLTTTQMNLMQSSKMTSSSSDTQRSASGTLQKTATTPTGVSATGSTDSFDVEISETSGTMTGEVETTGFADKYTNAQQKFANAGKVEGERSGEVMREGSIEDLLKVLELLPSSFADEINKALNKHFIYAYELDECLLPSRERTSRKEVIGYFNTNQMVNDGGSYKITIDIENYIPNSDMLVLTWGNAFVLCPIPVSGAGHSLGVLINNSYYSASVRVKYELKNDNTKLEITLAQGFVPVSNYTAYVIDYKL